MSSKKKQAVDGARWTRRLNVSSKSGLKCVGSFCSEREVRGAILAFGLKDGSPEFLARIDAS